MRQLLTMTSGVHWNEDYTDLKSDVAHMYAEPPAPGLDMTVSYVRKLPREAPPGTGGCTRRRRRTWLACW